MRIGWLRRSTIPWSACRAERIGPTSGAYWHWNTTTRRVMNPSTGSSKTMSALSIPDQGRAVGVVVDLERQRRSPRDLASGCRSPGQRTSGRPGSAFLCDVVVVFGADVVVVVPFAFLGPVCGTAGHEQATSATTRTNSDATDRCAPTPGRRSTSRDAASSRR